MFYFTIRIFEGEEGGGEVGIPSETNVGSYIFMHVVTLFLFNRVSLCVLSKIQHTLYMVFFFLLYIADKNLAIT